MASAHVHGHGVPLSSKPKIRKGLWSPEEDAKLISYITKNDLVDCSWNLIANQAGLQRHGKSCRLRWKNYLRPGLKRGGISHQEKQLIIGLQSILGNRWSQIAAHLPGRTDNEIKNFWNTSIKKTLDMKHRPAPFPLRPPRNPTPTTRQNTKPIVHADDGYNSSHSDSFHVGITTENQYPCGKDVIRTLNPDCCGKDLKYEPVREQNNMFPIDPDSATNHLISFSEHWIGSSSAHTNAGFSQAFSFPSLQAQGLSYKTAKASRRDQGINLLNTLPPLEAPGSAHKTLVYNTIPPLDEISDSPKWKIEKDGDIINENEIMIDSSSFTAPSGLVAWNTDHSYLNSTDLTDVYRAYTTNEVEDSVGLSEKTSHQLCRPLQCHSQGTAPAI